MFKKRLTIIVLLLILLINYNYAYSIIQQDTTIENDSFDIYKFTDHLAISDINSETKELVFNIPPVYDLMVKINGIKHTNISYTTDTLTINISNLSISNKSLNLDLIYLTDYYTSKQEGIWQLSYISRYANKLGNIEITLPRNSKLNNTSENPIAIETINDSLILKFSNLNSITIDYINTPTKTNNYSFTLITSIIILVIGTITFIIFKQKNKKEKTIVQNKSTNENLLLGLNENEQKIMKIVIAEEGQTQKSISGKLLLPKGTISRNIQKLIDKGYLEIKKYGISNKIFLGEVFRKNPK
ncbi:MAG: winged helix-turn-helix transcriptional regulator [archaeon]|jgi:uncharacterized membrane protein